MARDKMRTNRLEARRTRPAPEHLEGRQLLASGAGALSAYHVLALPPRIGAGRGNTNPIVSHPVQTSSPAELAALDNQGKIITGKDRAGDEYVIAVHGPGYVIVTDVTPNDGVLADDLDKIQIVGADPKRTEVIGQVTASARVRTDGTTNFQQLVSLNGVKSIKLNGFTLTQTIQPSDGAPNYSNTRISLPGGVGLLQFHDIVGRFNSSAQNVPIQVVIGDPSTPLTRAPIIRLDNIFNTVVDGSVASQPEGVPQTTPTVSIEVNGDIKHLDYLSSGAEPVNAGRQMNFNEVSITGRTAVRATAIDHLRVTGSARNTTFSRGAVTANNAFVGLRRLGKAQFGGNADAVGIFVDGPIKHVGFQRGLGNPTGSNRAATALGTPTSTFGYPAYGLLGGVVTSTDIDAISVAPANTVLKTGQDPDLQQITRTNSTTYYAKPGNALTSAAITASRNIRSAKIIGDSQNSEIKTGFDEPSYQAGLEPTRTASQIRRLRQRGDLIDSVNSATYRPNDGIYGNGNDTAGTGTITGHQNSRIFLNGHQTALRNFGAGNYARTKRGALPPLQAPPQAVS